MTQIGDFDASDLLSGLDGLEPIILQAGLEGLRTAGEYILGLAVDQVPLDKGILSNSGQAIVDEENLTFYVVFDTPYAVVQHEDMTFRHSAGRNAKYLERPLMSNGDTIINIIADALEAAIR